MRTRGAESLHARGMSPTYAPAKSRCVDRVYLRPSFGHREEPGVKLELRTLAQQELGELHALQLPKQICRISTTCDRNASSGIVSRTPHIPNLPNWRGLFGCVVGEMYWVCANKPASAEAVLRDPLDIGREESSHRKGLIYPYFTAVGAFLYNTPEIGYVRFVHLPIDLPNPNDAASMQTMTAEHLVGMKRFRPEISRPCIEHPSSEDDAY